MRKRSFSKPFSQVLTAGVLIAATVATASAAELFAGINGNGRLVLFSSDALDDAKVIKLSGLQPGETLLGLDVRPATGDLYVLGSSSRVYTIDTETGLASAIGSSSFATPLSGMSFGFDFNPTVDRIRIVSNTGQNLRVHPDTGAVAFTDGTLAYMAGDPGFGTTPDVVAAAYTNNDTDPATATVLYDIDAARDVLVLQSPPNDGVLATVGELGVSVEQVAGFDIATDGTAYASLVVSGAPGNSARASLYTIDLISGEATLVGKIGGPKPLTSLTALGQADVEVE